MPLDTNVTGGAWATTGTANAAAIPVNNTFRTMTFEPCSDLPPGATSSAVIRGALGAAAGFRITPTSGAGSPFNGGEEWHAQRFFIRLRPDVPGSIPAAFSASGFLINVSSQFTMSITNSDTAGQWYISQSNFFSGSTEKTWDGATANLNHSQWYEVLLNVRKHASEGRVELYLNGKLIHCHVGNTSSVGSDWYWDAPAIAGCTWEFAGPLQAWSGTDIPLAPQTSLDGSDSDVADSFLSHSYTLTTGASERQFDWFVETVSGSPTITATRMATAGINPSFKFMAIAGSAAAVRLTTKRPIGAPPYRDGWFLLLLPMVYLPSGASASFGIRNQADTADLVAVTISTAGVVSVNGTSTGITLPVTDRGALVIGLSDAGEVKVLVTDQTIFPSAGEFAAFSASAGTWVPPASVGVVKITWTNGSATTAFGPLWILRGLGLAGESSMTAAGVNGMTPVYTTANNILGGVNATPDALGVPGNINGGTYSISGKSKIALLVIGRSGMQLNDWMSRMFAGLTEAPGGCYLWLVDSGVNDVAQATDSASAVTRAGIVDALVPPMLAWATARRGRKLFLGTMIERSATTHWGGSPTTAIAQARLRCLRLINNRYRARLRRYSDPRVILCDVAAAIPYPTHAAMIDTTTPNPPHFTASGNTQYLSAFASVDIAAVNSNDPRSLADAVVAAINADVTQTTARTNAATAATNTGTLLTAVAALANSTDTSLAVPAQIIVPLAGTTLHKIRAVFTDADNANALVNMTSVSLTCVNAAGTSRSGRLSASTNPATGVYEWTYTSTAGDAQEQLLFEVIGTKSGDPGQWRNVAAAQAVNVALDQFLASDRATINTINSKLALDPFTGLPNVHVGGWNGVEVDYSPATYQQAIDVYDVVNGLPSLAGIKAAILANPDYPIQTNEDGEVLVSGNEGGGSDLDDKLDDIAAMLQQDPPTVGGAQQYQARRIVRGDSYGPDARPFIVARHRQAGWPLNLSEYGWAITSAKAAANQAEGETLAGTVSVGVPTGDARSLIVTLEDTSGLAVGIHNYQIKGTKDGSTWTAELGTVMVAADVA